MPLDLIARSDAPLANLAFKIILTLALAYGLGAPGSASAQGLEYCYSPPNQAQECFDTRPKAEKKMRESEYDGPYLRAEEEPSEIGNANWQRQFYVSDDQVPTMSPPGFMVGGWRAQDLGCTNVAFYDGNQAGYCADESEAANLWIARRSAFLSSYGCSYLSNSLVGNQSIPNAVYGENTGVAHYTLGPNGGRYIDESWWCPGWGTPDPVYHPTSVTKTVPLACPYGFSLRHPSVVWPRVCRSINRPSILVRKRQGEGCAASANPCYPGSGEKRRYETDFEFAGEPFVRTYRSLAQISQGKLGGAWNHSLGSRIGSATISPIFVSADGSMLSLKYVGYVDGAYIYRLRGLSDRAVRRINGQYEVVGSDGHTLIYSDTTGRLLKRVHASDPTRDLSFVHDGSGFLTEVIDGLQRKLTFHYDDIEITLPDHGAGTGIQIARRLSEIVLPDGGIVQYRYDTSGNLVEVTRPDGSTRQYHYNEPAFVAVPTPHLMTGISDNGVRYATFTYDQFGRATSSTLAGNAERTTLNYVSANQVDVTTPSGQIRRYTFDDSLERRILSIADAAGVIEYKYDADLLRSESKDRLGHRTTFTYVDGQVATLTQAAGTPEARSRSFSRDAMGRVLGETVTTASGTPTVASRTTVQRDAYGRTTAACRYDPGSPNQGYVCGNLDDAPAGVRQTTLRYCDAADVATPNSTCPLLGQLKSVDGPRTDVADITVYRYRGADDLGGCGTAGGACHRKGDLHQVIAPGGLATTYARYDLAGRPVRVVDANGVATDLEYNSRGWLTARKVRGANDGTETDDAITRLDYDDVGQVTKVTQPDGAFLEFSYDAAHRLTGIEDNLGNTVTYQLDGAGNRITEETRDAGNVLRHSLARIYDQLGQLETLADALATPTDFTYDAAGQVDTVTDAFNRTTDNDYDPLGRLKRSLANVNGTGPERAETRFQYDALDNLTAVIDPKGLTTSYGYNGLGDLVELDSPDTGSTTYTYDEAGNRRGQLDARGVQTGYLYDALNRLTQIDLSAPGQLLQFTYDTLPAVCPGSEAFPVGRLSQMSDPHGSAAYCYDRRGNVVRKAQTLAGTPAATVRYAYSAADRLTSITYPSGAVVTYQRDANGRITGVTAKPTATAAQVTLVSDVDYLPFGPASRMSFGNGRTLDRTYDTNYGIAGITDSAVDGVDLDYTLDAVGNVTGLGERLTGGATASRTVDYDGLDRLTELKDGATVAQRFEYDATGNRTKKVSGGTAAYAYPADSHRLAKVGSVVRNHDAAGNMLNLSTTRSFTYDDQGRMTQYLANGVPSREYRHNARGERVTKVVVSNPASNIHYVYDESGRLLGEYRPNGTRLKEYVWLDDTLVAVFSAHAGSYHQYVLTDHLGTPRAVVHPTSNAILWRWNLTGSAFGDHLPETNPDGDSTNYVFNLRYPGQYYDLETGLHYNYFRDYDPKTGRYMQSDPIGLAGGTSTFGYVSADPLRRSDPHGLIDSVRMGCAMNPEICADVLGEISRGQAAIQRLLGNCEAADYFDAVDGLIDSSKPLVTATQVAIAASPIGVTRNAAKSAIELHHLLPQARRFEQFFKRAGLNIEDFKIPLEKSRHRLSPGGIHTNSGGNWNRVWDDFFKGNPNATRQEILNQLARMRNDFGI